MILIFRIKGIALILDSSFKLRFLSFVLKVLWTIIPTKFMEFKQKKKPFINIIMQYMKEGRLIRNHNESLKYMLNLCMMKKLFPNMKLAILITTTKNGQLPTL